jgi:hypothetical protein
VDALDGVQSAQPAMVAGYWANIQFWLEEFRHLVTTSQTYEGRLERMKSAHHRYTIAHGGPFNIDEFGQPFQSATSTTSAADRKRIIGAARSSLLCVADRALNLKIISLAEYDSFMEKLKSLANQT